MKLKKYFLPTILPSFNTVLGRLGYNIKKSILDEKTELMIKKEIESASLFIKPAGHSLDCRILNQTEDTITLESNISFHSQKLSKILENAKKVTLLISTIGKLLPDEAARLMKNEEITKAVILDAIGSEAVETFADYMTGVLMQENTVYGLKPSMRYSPGYGDLNMEIHKEILPLLEADKIGISCHKESYILIPEKSISAIIGWLY
jgi:5-methyltetrahydrofolate--homocysteine methyltransferase